MHTWKTILASHSRLAAIENLSERTLWGRRNQPTPSPAGRLYIELAIEADDETHPVENKKEKKNKKKEKSKKRK